MKKVFIDGQEGTTGLQIFDRLKSRDDLEIIEIPDEKRKDIDTKKDFLNRADLVILCLPDKAAKESVSLLENPETCIIDASTAFRTDDDWVYGLPEMNSSQREKIATAKRISNPGCYPTGVILPIYPLISEGLLPDDYPLSVHAVSGYSGGGKKLIAAYEEESENKKGELSCRPYSIGKKHKHVSEMHKHTGLKYPPIFTPSVGNFYNGMVVTIPVFTGTLKKKVDSKDFFDVLSNHYKSDKFVRVMELNTTDHFENGFLSPLACNGTNYLDIFVFEHDQQTLLMSRLDNLGKGASGAAVQSMNIVFGVDEGLSL